MNTLPDLTMTRGDTRPTIGINAYEGALALPVASAVLTLERVFGFERFVFAPAVSGATVTYAWQPGDTDIAPGFYKAVWTVTVAGGTMITRAGIIIEIV